MKIHNLFFKNLLITIRQCDDEFQFLFLYHLGLEKCEFVDFLSRLKALR